MEIFRRFFTTGLKKPVQPEPTQDVSTEEGENDLSIQVDRPIKCVAEDIFDRASFAQQIAETIARRRDPSSLVVGIYGPWGDGKTSTLAMVKEFLEPHINVLTLDYNPWFYGDSTEAISRSFFNSIKNKLETSGWFSKENIGDLMSTYGKAIPKIGDAVQSFGDAITTEALIETRDKVSDILRKHRKKIVVFIDDIDRLDRREIQTLFKLVRLSGDFDHTTYVLAFDDTIVAEALGEAYGTGDPSAGRRFLEKIVQVPLKLPSARLDKLRDLMFSTCDRVMNENGIELSEADGPELGHALMEAFGRTLKTPRRVKLFDNAISFAVPILKGEVRIVDQIEIEALRVFYPTIYDVIRANPDVVLKGRDRHLDHRDPRPSPVDDAIEKLDAEDLEKESLKRFLRQLFPRLNNMQYGENWNSIWASEKRICSSDYFQRYFTYAVPTGDISDHKIDALLAQARTGDEEGVAVVIAEAYRTGAAELLIRKLRRHEDDLDLDAAPTLISAIAKGASTIPTTRDIMFGTFVFSQAAIFVCKIVERMDEPRQDVILATTAENADSLAFLDQIMHWSRARTSKGRDLGFLTTDRLQPLTAILARRFFAAADENNIIDCVGQHFGELTYSIARDGNDATKAQLLERLATFLEANPQNALSLLKALGGRSQGGDGVIRVADLTTGTYASISKLLNPETVYTQLREIYGPELEIATWEDKSEYEGDEDRRIANQFSSIHRNPVRDDPQQVEA